MAPDFQVLDGWAQDDHAAAMPAIRRSCERFAGYGEGRQIGSTGNAGRGADWRPICAAARQVPAGDTVAARLFFERWFTPQLARTVSYDGEGLFTGYYEPELNGSWTPSERYSVPLYRSPGRPARGSLPSRGQIAAGALAGRGLELLWVDDEIDAFFLEIQGSGRVRMTDGTVVGVGYAGQNGQSYYPIGRYLVEIGVAQPADMSLQVIEAWLRANPGQAAQVMNLNRSYVFFKLLPDVGARGAMGVELTPGRSLAVDPDYVPLGVPVWLDADHAPVPSGVLRRLVVAQDTGGAIKGPMRGDLFWGHGPDAKSAAGRMKARGAFTLLVPRSAVRSRDTADRSRGDES